MICYINSRKTNQPISNHSTQPQTTTTPTTKVNSHHHLGIVNDNNITNISTRHIINLNPKTKLLTTKSHNKTEQVQCQGKESTCKRTINDFKT